MFEFLIVVKGKMVFKVICLLKWRKYLYLNVGFIVFLLWNVLDFKIFFNLVFFYVLFYNVIYMENVELDNDNYIYIVYVL